ncbi:MAG: VWA domain-containing protein [Bacteroidetes bacterium]|nr:VWA domain-containing protein [Bacteroidota bacterium]
MQFISWAISIILAVAAGYWVYRTDKKRGTPMPWLTAVLRGIVVLLTLLLLLAPPITITKNETEKPVIVFLQDNSASIATALGKDTSNYTKTAQQLTERLAGKYKVVTWGFGDNVSTDSPYRFTKPSTDIAAALNRVQEYYGTQNLGAVILASDGKYNQGSNPLYQQLSIQPPVYSIGIGDGSEQKDLRITQAYYNKTASLNSQFEIRADIVATLLKGYNNTLRLSENGQGIGTVPLSINNTNYDRSVSFAVKADKPGLHHYIIDAPAADGETNTTNNRKDIFIEVVDEKKNILIVGSAPHPDINAIKEALSDVETYKVTVHTGGNLPPLGNYRVIIAHDLPSVIYNYQSQFAASHKPIWYILGNQTNTAALYNATPATLNVNVAAMHDAYPAFNPSFSIFTTPQNLQAILDKMPPLSVPMGSIQPNGNTDILFKQKDNGQPLWILQQGTTPMALTSGSGIWRWRLYEYKNFNTHNTIDECIRQTVSFLAANSTEKPFYTSLSKYVWSDQEAVYINAYVLNASNQQINTPDVQLTITDSTGKKQNFSFERNGTSYRLNTGIWPEGNYTYTAQTHYNGTAYSASGSFTITHSSPEQMEGGADYKLLYSIAKKYNGSFLPAQQIASLYDSVVKNEKIKPVIQSNTITVSLVDWRWYFLVILIIAVAEWLLRKYWLAQ